MRSALERLREIAEQLEQPSTGDSSDECSSWCPRHRLPGGVFAQADVLCVRSGAVWSVMSGRSISQPSWLGRRLRRALFRAATWVTTSVRPEIIVLDHGSGIGDSGGCRRIRRSGRSRGSAGWPRLRNAVRRLSITKSSSMRCEQSNDVIDAADSSWTHRAKPGLAVVVDCLAVSGGMCPLGYGIISCMASCVAIPVAESPVRYAWCESRCERR